MPWRDQKRLAFQVGTVFGQRSQLWYHLPARDTFELRTFAMSLTGLVTNGHPTFQRRKLERFDLARHFDAILIEGEWGVGKPDPSIFREALSRMNARPESAWMVGDNLEADIAGAQAVGMTAVWIDHAGEGAPTTAQPNRIVRKLADLLAL